jgi:hypothetical protein
MLDSGIFLAHLVLPAVVVIHYDYVTGKTANTRRKTLRPSPKVEKQMQPYSESDFDKLLERAIFTTPARKPSPKSH